MIASIRYAAVLLPLALASWSFAQVTPPGGAQPPLRPLTTLNQQAS